MKRTALSCVACILAVAAVMPASVQSQGPRCGPSANIPLTDLTRPYRGQDFGMYPGQRTTPPDGHLAAGMAAAKRVQPLDANGRPAANGRIVLMSLGMSNTASEFGQFVADAGGNAAINGPVTILNGSLSGADAMAWTDRTRYPWENALRIANSQGRSTNQVQAIWIKQAHLKTEAFPEELRVFQTNLERIIQIARSVFPNLQIVYVSSRTRSGAETRRGPGEPQAYETAFAVRRLIQDQIEGRGPFAGGTPWLAWGPYLWSNGTARSDGLVWDCSDLQADALHPTASGDRKVSGQLMAFFMTHETATPWFLDAARATGGPTIDALTPSATTGPTPLAVTFSPTVTGATRFYWSFGDGTSSTVAQPRKTFVVPGSYTVRLTTADDTGRWTSRSMVVEAVR